MMKWFIVFFFIIVAAGVVFFLQQRRELPFQEIIAFDQSIAIVNARNWYANDIYISIASEGGRDAVKLKYDKNGVCVQRNLLNNKKYLVSLYRTDFKGRLLYKKKTVEVAPKKVGDKYTVLVGASIGSGWQFDLIHQRVNVSPGMRLGFRPYYYFDKTKMIDSIINLPVPVHGVIIKECSAYFPRDIEASMQDVKRWVSRLQSQGILPILATAVPVTEQRDKKSPGKQESILMYNNSIKSLAIDQGLPLIDLEKTLRISDENRHLKNEYVQSDGAHLIAPGYAVLDNMMEKRLLEWN